MSGHARSLFTGDDRLVSPAPGANQDYLEHQRRSGSERGQIRCLGFWTSRPGLAIVTPCWQCQWAWFMLSYCGDQPPLHFSYRDRDGAQLTERMTFPRSQCNGTTTIHPVIREDVYRLTPA